MLIQLNYTCIMCIIWKFSNVLSLGFMSLNKWLCTYRILPRTISTYCISVMSTSVSLTAKWLEIMQINTQVSIQWQTHILPIPKCSGLPFIVKKGRVPPIGTQLVTCPMHLLLPSTSTCPVPRCVNKCMNTKQLCN